MNKMKMRAPGVAADGINTSSLTSTQGLPFSQWQRLDAPLSKKSPSEAFIEKTCRGSLDQTNDEPREMDPIL